MQEANRRANWNFNLDLNTDHLLSLPNIVKVNSMIGTVILFKRLEIKTFFYFRIYHTLQLIRF